MSRNWYAIYTRPRWEKKTDRLLHERGVLSYCPLHKSRRRWSDRVKLVEIPLFTSYVFVCIDEAEMNSVRTTPGVLNFVYWNGKPAVIPVEEIQSIKRFLDAFDDVELVRADLVPGDQVAVATGPFADRQAQVLEVGKKKVKLRIDSLGYEILAYLDRAKVQKVEEAPRAGFANIE